MAFALAAQWVDAARRSVSARTQRRYEFFAVQARERLIKAA
jgi:hypothetical protein